MRSAFEQASPETTRRRPWSGGVAARAGLMFFGLVAGLTSEACFFKKEIRATVTMPPHGIEGREIPANEEEAELPILVLADDQLQNIYAGHIKSNSLTVDELITRVAIRPPQLDMWSPELLRRILCQETGGYGPGCGVVAQLAEPRPPAGLVLHLGDAANTGCTNELERFFRTLRESIDLDKTAWLMAPGNHDSFLMGNFGDLPDNRQLRWDGVDSYAAAYKLPQATWGAACAEPAEDGHEVSVSRPANKYEFLTRYLAELERQGVELEKKPISGDCQHFTATAQPASPLGARHYAASGVICSLAWKDDVETGFPWDSYIVQGVDAGGGTRIYLLDSTQVPRVSNSFLSSNYVATHGIIATGEKDGDAHYSQVRWILGDYAEAQRRDVRHLVLAAHHPWGVMNAPSRAALLGGLQPTMFLSAHTHFPTEILFHPTVGTPLTEGGPGFAELNVGSMSDWPAEGARIGYREGDAGQVFTWQAVQVGRRDSRDVWFGTCRRFGLQWQADQRATTNLDGVEVTKRPAPDDYYLAFKTGEPRYLDGLLAAIQRYDNVLNHGADPLGIAVARKHPDVARKARAIKAWRATYDELMAGKTPLDRLANEYGVCQALWGSEALDNTHAFIEDFKERYDTRRRVERSGRLAVRAVRFDPVGSGRAPR